MHLAGMHQVLLGTDGDGKGGGILLAISELSARVLEDTGLQKTSSVLLLACFGTLITAAFSVPLILRLASSIPAQLWDEPRRWIYSAVIMVSPLMIAFLQCIAVIFPDRVHMLLVMVAFWEDLSVLCVLLLLLSFLGSSSKEQLQAFEQEEPTRMMWVLSPIVCFCCYSCMELRKPRASDLTAIWICVLQFIVLNPTFAMIDASAMGQRPFVILLSFVSLIVAVYAIVVLIEGAQGTLAARMPHCKFWSLKGLIIATKLSHRILQHFVLASPTETAGAVTTMVAAPFALVMYFAYSTKDLATSCEDKEDKGASPSDTRVPSPYIGA